MVSTMRHLMDDIIEQERQKRRSELEVLQSQINRISSITRWTR